MQMFSFKEQKKMADELRDKGFELLHEGIGPNVQRTGDEPGYVIFLPSRYLTSDTLELDIRQVLPALTTIQRKQMSYWRQGLMVTETWVYIN